PDTSNTNASSGLSLITVSSFAQADVVVEGKVTVSSGKFAGLVARYTGPGDSNMYFGALVGTGTSSFQAQLWKNVGGAWSQLTGVPVASGTGILHLEVIGSTLKLSLDGNLVTSANDGSITAAGTVGTRTTSGLTVDNFTTDAIAVPAPTLPFTDSFTGS